MFVYKRFFMLPQLKLMDSFYLQEDVTFSRKSGTCYSIKWTMHHLGFCLVKLTLLERERERPLHKSKELFNSN